MKIQLTEITIKELTAGYQDNAEEGVSGYGGKMNELYGNALLETLNRAKDCKKQCTDPIEARYWAIQVTELEKIYAHYCLYLTSNVLEV